MGDIRTVVGEVMLLLPVGGGETTPLREPEEGRVLNVSSAGLDERGKCPAACWFLEGRVFVEEDGTGGGGGGIE